MNMCQANYYIIIHYCMKEPNRIMEGDRVEQHLDMDRYRKHLPAVINQYYNTNLLDIIDKLPTQPPKNAPFIFKSNILDENVEKETKVSSMAQLIQHISLAKKHEVDGLGNDTHINQYQIVKALLGKGSHSFVKLGKNKGNNYAIKTLSIDRIKKKFYIKEKQIIDMINCQINLLIKLKSPFIIGFEEAIFVPEKQRVFIVLEFCSKGSLLKLIHKSQAIEFPQWEHIAGRYFVQIVKGLKHMHDKNIIHRDMKSDNVLINQKDEIKIIDFNVSSEVPTNGEIIINDKFVGTRTYAPPELLLADAEPRVVDGRLIDIWALGVTFLEMLEKRHPFSYTTIAQLRDNITKPVAINPKYEPELQKLIKSMLHQDITKRPTTAEILQNPWVKKMSK